MIEPVLHPVPIGELHPTQITVGMREVTAKRKEWRGKGWTKGADFLGTHMFPVVLGPKARYYIIDHHHLALALKGEGVEHVLVNVIADLRRLEPDAFWFVMANRNWMYSYDEKGRRREHTDLPKALDGMIDDPFRSLAGELRRLGGYSKETAPYSEFQWADYLRRRMKLKDLKKDFNSASEQAMKLAKSGDADYLPGWCGPTHSSGTAVGADLCQNLPARSRQR
jgi:hypothetical protein